LIRPAKDNYAQEAPNGYMLLGLLGAKTEILAHCNGQRA
jgi:hypothetical protein